MRRSPECGQSPGSPRGPRPLLGSPQERAHISPLRGSALCQGSTFVVWLHSSFWEEGDEQALLLWMLGLLREQDGPHQPGNSRGQGTEPQRGSPTHPAPGLGLGGCRGGHRQAHAGGSLLAAGTGAEPVAPVGTEPRKESLYHRN